MEREGFERNPNRTDVDRFDERRFEGRFDARQPDR